MLATYSMLSEYWTHLTDHDLKLLNKNLIADILVNGFTTENIKIDQSTKLCMDPLIRKVNGDKGIEYRNRYRSAEYRWHHWIEDVGTEHSELSLRT